VKDFTEEFCKELCPNCEKLSSEEKYVWKEGKEYVGINKKMLLTPEEYSRAVGRMIRFHKWVSTGK